MKWRASHGKCQGSVPEATSVLYMYLRACTIAHFYRIMNQDLVSQDICKAICMFSMYLHRQSIHAAIRSMWVS